MRKVVARALSAKNPNTQRRTATQRVSGNLKESPLGIKQHDAIFICNELSRMEPAFAPKVNARFGWISSKWRFSRAHPLRLYFIFSPGFQPRRQPAEDAVVQARHEPATNADVSVRQSPDVGLFPRLLEVLDAIPPGSGKNIHEQH
jgi:hypothetical protein